MKINNKKLENAIVELTVAFDSEEWKATQEKALDKLAKNVKIDGFRPGKAPAAMVRARVSKASVLEEATDMILQTKFVEILTEANVEPVAQPALSVQKVDADELEVQILVPVKPQVELGEYKGLEVKKGRVTVTKKEIEEQLANYQTQFAELTVKEGGKVAKGDTAVIDFEGFVDGEAFEGGKGENYPLTIGSGSFIPGFEEQLIGAEPEKEVEVKVTFPEDYHAEDLKGKEAVFKCTVHEIKAKELPELDDEFASEVSEFDTLDELKADIKAKIKEQKVNDGKRAQEDAAVDAIIESAKMDLPEAMVDTQARQMLDEFAQRMQQQGLTLDQYMQFTGMTADKMMDELRPQAEKRIKTRLVLEAIAKAENIEITDEKLDEEIAKMAEAYQMEADKLKSFMGDKEKEQMKQDMAVQEAITFVVDNAVEK